MTTMIDIPSGYLYGFPRVYDRDLENESMLQWLIKCGVPPEHAEECVYVRMWKVDDVPQTDN